MKKFAIAIALMLLMGVSTVESNAQYARRPHVGPAHSRVPVRRYYRWAVRVRNNATRRYRVIRVNATNQSNASRRALALARAKWRPNHRGFHVASVRRI